MTIDVQLGDIGHGLLGSSQLSTINQSELALGLGSENIGHHSETPEQPLSATPSPAGSLQDEDMDDFKVRGYTCGGKHRWLCASITASLEHLYFGFHAMF